GGGAPPVAVDVAPALSPLPAPTHHLAVVAEVQNGGGGVQRSLERDGVTVRRSREQRPVADPRIGDGDGLVPDGSQLGDERRSFGGVGDGARPDGELPGTVKAVE